MSDPLDDRVNPPGKRTAMTPRPRFAIGTTAFGPFGVVWNERGIVRTWLHARTDGAARAAILRAFPYGQPAAPAPAIADAIDGVACLLDGEPVDLTWVELDMGNIAVFDRRVYEVSRAIPPGSTMTYGAIAAVLGEEPMRARDVGQALAGNPFAPIVPCHRVVGARGRLGGYSAPGGASTKRRLLELEGAEIVATNLRQPGLFDLT